MTSIQIELAPSYIRGTLASLGYNCVTLMPEQFDMAETEGEEAVEKLFNGYFDECKDDKESGTELSMILNHKIWEHYHQNNEPLSRLYDKLWKQMDGYIIENWKGDKLSYYLKTTD